MNAVSLYIYLCEGAVLRTRWRKRQGGMKPRVLHTLKLNDGTVISIQKSMIDSLIRNGFIRSISLQTKQADYEVIL